MKNCCNLLSCRSLTSVGRVYQGTIICCNGLSDEFLKLEYKPNIHAARPHSAIRFEEVINTPLPILFVLFDYKCVEITDGEWRVLHCVRITIVAFEVSTQAFIGFVYLLTASIQRALVFSGSGVEIVEGTPASIPTEILVKKVSV